MRYIYNGEHLEEKIKKGSVKQRLQNAVEKILDLNLRNVSINTLLYVA